MSSRIQTKSDLPSDFQNRLSSTFDYSNIKQLLTHTYYRGPIPEGEGGSGGYGLRKRGHVLAGMPGNWRESILRKAKEVDVLLETSEGYVTTDRGAKILERMMYCDDCGTQELPALIPVGHKPSVYVTHRATCPSCRDFQVVNPDGSMEYGKIHHFERDGGSLEAAVEAMEGNQKVELWLNGMSLTQAKKQI